MTVAVPVVKESSLEPWAEIHVGRLRQPANNGHRGALQDSKEMGYEHDLHGRLGRAVRLWREATSAPLPRLPRTEPGMQVTTLELELVDLLADTATPERAADVRFQLAELTEGLSRDNPVRRRVEDLLPALCRLEERGAQRSDGEIPFR